MVKLIFIITIFIVRHYQKIERYHTKDKLDIHEMFERGLVNRIKLLELFNDIEPKLNRYPSIEPESFRERVELLTEEQK